MTEAKIKQELAAEESLQKQHEQDLHQKAEKEANDKRLEEIAKNYRAKLLAEDKKKLDQELNDKHELEDKAKAVKQLEQELESNKQA